MATVKTLHPGNTALQTEVWTLSLAEAGRVACILDCRTGTYWHEHLIKVVNRARRARSETVVIWTAGFSTGVFSNALYASDSAVTRIEAA